MEYKQVILVREDLKLTNKLSESFKIKDFEAQPNFVWRGLNKFTPCSGLRRKIINASLTRACDNSFSNTSQCRENTEELWSNINK